jgi:hypothetical protein
MRLPLTTKLSFVGPASSDPETKIPAERTSEIVLPSKRLVPPPPGSFRKYEMPASPRG